MGLKKNNNKLKDKGADVKIGFILEFSHLKYNKTNILHSGIQTWLHQKSVSDCMGILMNTETTKSHMN